MPLTNVRVRTIAQRILRVHVLKCAGQARQCRTNQDVNGMKRQGTELNTNEMKDRAGELYGVRTQRTNTMHRCLHKSGSTIVAKDLRRSV